MASLYPKLDLGRSPKKRNLSLHDLILIYPLPLQTAQMISPITPKLTSKAGPRVLRSWMLVLAFVSGAWGVSVSAKDAAKPESKELLALRDSWSNARLQATLPIDKKYADALLALKTKLTKQGDLNAALAVDAELSKIVEGTLTPAATNALTDSSVPGVYMFEILANHSSVKLELLPGGALKINGVSSAETWDIKNGKLNWHLAKGTINTFDLHPKNGVLKGTTDSGKPTVLKRL